MEAARLHAPGRLQIGLICALFGLALVSWLWVDRRMVGMDAGPGTDPGTLGFFVVSWIVMMAAMMLPSIVPMVSVFATIQRQRSDRGASRRGVSTALFVGGYLVAWTCAGLIAYALFVGTRSVSIGALNWNNGGRYFAGLVLVCAAAYELTPAKHACLRRCRGPLSFVMEHWREGRIGALRMGALHGTWCVGCCWALMAALFALGVMSLTWMVVIAAAIAAEKLLPWPTATTRAIAGLLAIGGVVIVLAPASVPALTLPHSPAAHRAMGTMGMGMGATPKAPAAGINRPGAMPKMGPAPSPAKSK